MIAEKAEKETAVEHTHHKMTAWPSTVWSAVPVWKEAMPKAGSPRAASESTAPGTLML